jgi:hypothetical protein
MRGADETSGSLFSYVDLEARIPARHPLRTIRQVVNEALASLDAEFEALLHGFRSSLYCARAADPGEPAPDTVLGPLRAAVDGTDAV